MFHPSSVSVAEAVVTWTCVFSLLFPRVDPKDRDFFGGDLSRGFRMAFFAVGLLVTIRCLLTRDHRIEKEEFGDGGMLFFSQVALESFLSSFLSLLMPYLLQCQLRNKINIRPGQNLMSWLYWILFLQLTGLMGRIYLGDRWWAVKRAGDSLSVVPVISTAKLHFRIVPGQVKTMHQTLSAMEYTYFVCTWFAVVSYGVFGQDDHSFPFRGFRVAGFFLPRFRMFYHGFLLNVMDEITFNYQQPTRSEENSNPSTTGSATDVNAVETESTLQMTLI